MSFLAVYLLQRFQEQLPFNPTGVTNVAPLGAFNAAVSFMTNTNWQWFGGESTMSHLTQMLGFTVQNFVSAAAGMAVVVAIIRGITRRGARTIGNFWVDLTRTTLRVLLPLSFVVAIVLSIGGVVQNLNGYTEATPIDPAAAAALETGTQSIPGGPVASQVAIKQLGHERRRVLQRQLGPPVRERRRLDELRRELGDPRASRWHSSWRTGS